MKELEESLIFTLHFATINTFQKSLYPFPTMSFTLHFATINTTKIVLSSEESNHLHYTLLLLIQI